MTLAVMTILTTTVTMTTPTTISPHKKLNGSKISQSITRA
jgi:hypothetical protein